MTRYRAAVVLATLLLGPGLAGAASAVSPRLATTAAVNGEWSPTEPCAASVNRLHFRGDTLAFFSGAQRMSEYEVTVTETGDRVTVRVIRVVHEAQGPGGLPPGSAIQYRRESNGLRLVGVALRGDAFAGPTVTTLYRRCK